jgi:hypothetical protein
MVANSPYIAFACIAFLAQLIVGGDNVKFEKVLKDGEVVEIYFYGPASWLSEPGERFDRFQKLQCVILQCGTISDAEMRYLSTCKSIEGIATVERFESSAVSFLPGALNELSRMTWLKSLSIYSEPLEPREWEFLKDLHSLESFTVEGIDETGVSNLRSIESLASLRLHEYKTARVPEMVSTLAGLQEFSLTQPFPSIAFDSASLKYLSKLRKLRSLTIDGIQQSGIDWIAALERLQFLSISINDQQVKLDRLGDLKELTSLTIVAGTLNKLDLQFLKHLRKLQFLQLLVRDNEEHHLSRTVPYDALSELTDLTIASHVDAETLHKIAILPKLKRLSVRGFAGDCDTEITELRRKSVELNVH